MMTVITAIFHSKNVLTKNVLPRVVMMMLSLLMMMMMMMTGFQLSVIAFLVSVDTTTINYIIRLHFFKKRKY